MMEPNALEGMSVGGSVPSRRFALPERILVEGVGPAGLWEQSGRDIQNLDVDDRASALARGVGDAEPAAEGARGDSYVDSLGGTRRFGVGGNLDEADLASPVRASREEASSDDPEPSLATPYASHFAVATPTTLDSAPVKLPNGPDRNRPSVDRFTLVASDSASETEELESNENGCTPLWPRFDDTPPLASEARAPAGLVETAETDSASSPAKTALVPPRAEEVPSPPGPASPPFRVPLAGRVERPLTASKPDDTSMPTDASWRPRGG